MIKCKYCGSIETIKFGTHNGVQTYKCLNCGRRFTNPDTPEGMKYPARVIGSALNLFYEGMSQNAIRRQLHLDHGVLPSDSTVYEWIVRYTRFVLEKQVDYRAQTCSTWVADETVIPTDAIGNVWFWDVIDADSRFLLASNVSITRTISAAKTLFRRALNHAECAPRRIITDKMLAYPQAVWEVFGPLSPLIRSKGFVVQPNTNLIERFHGTLKARTKIMRGLKNIRSVEFIMGGWLVHYNFFRPHEALGHRTPGSAAGIEFPYRNWTEVVKA